MLSFLRSEGKCKIRSVRKKHLRPVRTHTLSNGFAFSPNTNRDIGKERKMVDDGAFRVSEQNTAFGMREDIGVPYGKIRLILAEDRKMPFGRPVGVAGYIDSLPFRFDEKYAVENIRELRAAVRNVEIADEKRSDGKLSHIGSCSGSGEDLQALSASQNAVQAFFVIVVAVPVCEQKTAARF